MHRNRHTSRLIIRLIAVIALALALGLTLSPALGGVVIDASPSPPAHSPILIQHDADFSNCGCVVGGSGTPAEPYLIDPLAINNAPDNSVLIDGAKLTKSFVLRNLTIAGNRTDRSAGIVLRNINPRSGSAIVAQVWGAETSIQNSNLGVVIKNSHNVTLDGEGANPSGPGLGSRGAGTVNGNITGGFDIEDSSNITIRGWQINGNGVEAKIDWVNLDPVKWSVRGIRLFRVTHSTIDHNAANSDDPVSFSLFNSSGNMLSGNTAYYPDVANFVLADGSSENTVVGNVAGTGDYVGILVADPLPGTATHKKYGPTHDNLIQGNQINAIGPTGNEINAGEAPAFLGGIVVLNGTYNNVIADNQVWASLGADLVWAQEVLDPTTPIGVAAYPPNVHCNVMVSEGGGGVPNLNGNRWTGNTAQRIDTCLPPQ